MLTRASKEAGSGIALRLSVTEACQLRCTYCRPATGGSEACHGRAGLERDELMAIVRHLHEAVGIEKLRFTGGEPLLRRDLPEIVAACAALGISDLSLTTNGQRLAPVAAELRQSGLHRINISLDSLEAQTFARITRGGDLDATLAGISAAQVAGFEPVKLNMVVLRGINDHECCNILDYGMRTNCQVRFLELMPIGVAAGDFDSHLVPTAEVRECLRSRFSLQELPWDASATSRDYLGTDEAGRSTICGFISPTTEPFCGACRRLRLTNDGRLFGCLASRTTIDLARELDPAAAGTSQDWREAVRRAMALKQTRRNLSDQRDMAHIGG